MRRTILVSTVVLAAVLVAQPALAFCIERPFDDVVRASDAVLVGTITDAHPVGPHENGIMVTLYVTEVLKGSAADGERVVITSCGPYIGGPDARSLARSLLGTRVLFMLTVHNDGIAYKYSDITTPKMTLDEQITRARQLLGRSPTTGTASDETQPGLPRGSGLVLLAVAIVVLGAALLAARRLRSAW